MAELKLVPNLPALPGNYSGLLRNCRISSCLNQSSDWDEILNARQSGELRLDEIEEKKSIDIKVALPLSATPTECKFKATMSYNCDADILEVTSDVTSVDILTGQFKCNTVTFVNI